MILYRVVRGCAVPRAKDGGDAGYFYPGKYLPANIAKGEGERMVELGICEKVTIADAEPEQIDAGQQAGDGGESGQQPEGDALEDKTLTELREYAKTHEIDLGGAARKDDVVAAIRAAQG